MTDFIAAWLKRLYYWLRYDALRPFFSFVLSLGVIASIGALAFAGTILLGGGLWIASASAFFAVAIEGIVYFQNIFQTILKLFGIASRSQNQNKTGYLERSVALLKLKLLSQHPDYADIPLIKSYLAQKDHLNQLDHFEHDLEPLDWLLHPIRRWRLHKELQRQTQLLEKIEDLFIEYITSSEPIPENMHSIFGKKLVDEQIDIKNNITSEIARRSIKKGSFFIFLLALGSGTSAFFASVSSINTGIVAFSAGLAASAIAPYVIFFIAGFAALGFSLMLANNLMKVWHNLEFEEACQNFTKLGRGAVIGRFLLFIVTLFATLATFWTWGQDSMDAISKVIQWSSDIVEKIVWGAAVIMSIATLKFDYSGSLETFQKLAKKISAAVAAREPAEEQWQQLSFLGKAGRIWDRFIATPFMAYIWSPLAAAFNKPGHNYNIFRLVEAIIRFPFSGAVLALHTAAIGTSADQAPPLDIIGIPYEVPDSVTAGVSAFVEGAVDGGYLGHDDEEDEHEEVATADHTNLNTPAKKSMDHSEPLPFELAKDAHVHFNFAGVMLAIICVPLRIASFVWDFFAELTHNSPKQSLRNTAEKNWQNKKTDFLSKGNCKDGIKVPAHEHHDHSHDHKHDHDHDHDHKHDDHKHATEPKALDLTVIAGLTIVEANAQKARLTAISNKEKHNKSKIAAWSRVKELATSLLDSKNVSDFTTLKSAINPTSVNNNEESTAQTLCKIGNWKSFNPSTSEEALQVLETGLARAQPQRQG